MSEESPKVTVRLRKKLLAEIDRKCRRDGLTRSQATQLALAAWVGLPELGEPLKEGTAGFSKRKRREVSRAGVEGRWGAGN